MSTYKKHCCRQIARRKAQDTWEDKVMVILLFLFLVSLLLIS